MVFFLHFNFTFIKLFLRVLSNLEKMKFTKYKYPFVSPGAQHAKSK